VYQFIEIFNPPPPAVTIEWDYMSKRVEPSPAHIWCSGPLVQCVSCGGFKGPDGHLPCDPSKLAGKVECCCECGNDYPKSDSIAGHIFCPKCRLEDLERLKKTSRKFERVACPRCGCKRAEMLMRACIYPGDPMTCLGCGHHYRAADVAALWEDRWQS
jgi:hypothetical protein